MNVAIYLEKVMDMVRIPINTCTMIICDEPDITLETLRHKDNDASRWELSPFPLNGGRY